MYIYIVIIIYVFNYAPLYYHWGKDNTSGHKILLGVKKRGGQAEKLLPKNKQTRPKKQD